jgi:hypothetical protein
MLYNLNTTSNKIQTSNNLYLDYDEYSSRELAEKENRHFLEKLNGSTFVLETHAPKTDDNVRYKIGLCADAQINTASISDLQIGNKINDDQTTVLGVVVHEMHSLDRIFCLNGVRMTEWVKVQFKNNWICVRDHPEAVPSSILKSEKLYSIITSDHTIKLDNGEWIRDFIEF